MSLLVFRADLRGPMKSLRTMQMASNKPVFMKLRKPMHRDQRDHKAKQRGPRSMWAPRASTTMARYARGPKHHRGPILGSMPNSRYIDVSEGRMVMKTRIPWFNAHQDGPTKVGHGSILPQRQAYWISGRFITEACREFRRALFCRFYGIRYP